MRNVTWAIVWSNPHRPRPPDKPEELLRITRLVSSTTEVPPEIRDFPIIGSGYCIQCWVEPTPGRQLTEAQKQKIRRSNLRRRLYKRFPLFAESWYREALERKPDYYGTEINEPQH